MPQPLKNHFAEVTLLVTHYNRSHSLERLLNSFEQLNCSFEAIVVSDDGSNPEHLNYLKQLQKKKEFNLITTPVNRGLGNNINKGQDAVTTPYTLYVQEDFTAQPGFVESFPDAFSFIKKDNTIDYIRFYAYFPYPNQQPYSKGFNELIFKKWRWGYYKYFQYSDHPHIRRSSFFQKFGRYTEGVSSDETENRMCLSFIRNNGKALCFENFTAIFDQVNTSTEPSTANFRKEWRSQNSFWVKALRQVYLQFKSLRFHINYFFYSKQPR
jgi:glycosyltransferase involved in cell wall biosynthesis